jgi:hypothetical protein
LGDVPVEVEAGGLQVSDCTFGAGGEDDHWVWLQIKAGEEGPVIVQKVKMRIAGCLCKSCYLSEPQFPYLPN